MRARVLIVGDRPQIGPELAGMDYLVTAVVRTASDATTAMHQRMPDVVLVDTPLRDIDLGGHHVPIVYVPEASTARDVESAIEMALSKREFEELLRLEAEELRETRDMLAREHTVLNATLEHIDDGVMLVDASGNIILVNRAAREMFPIADSALALTMESLGEIMRQEAGADPNAREGDYVLLAPRRIVTRAEQTITLPGGSTTLVTWRDVTAHRDLVAERERQLVVDPLTGITNRRGAETALRVEDSRRKRTNLPLSVVLFDVDFFKRVNDEHGHAVGDEVLVRVARALAGSARLTDVIARWGGEEFIAIVSSSAAGAATMAERARKSIESLDFTPVPRVTLSAGVAELAQGETPASAIARADERLYEAKRAGRNRVM
jgi:diguanylate cyclase (GGDEF)-like protein